MRDFRDAKAMAHTMRAALAAKGLNITVSQSLELIAEAFGVADWNTLSAAIRAQPAVPRDAALPPTTEIEGPSSSGRAGFSKELQATLHRAITLAKQRKHEYAMLEHLLLALTDDPDALAVMNACNADVAVMKEGLATYLDNELTSQITDEADGARPSAAFQRVVQRAVLHVQASGRSEVDGAQLFVAIFSEEGSRAARVLDEQGATRVEAVNFIVRGAIKRGGGEAA